MKSIILIFVLTFLISSNPQTDRIKYVEKNLASHGFSEKNIKQIFSKFKPYQPKSQSQEKRKNKNDSINWNKLTKNIMAKKSIKQGKSFIGAHRKILEQAEKKFDVPKEVIVAVLRIETNFGQFLGNYDIATLFYNQLMTANDWKKAADNFVDLFIYCRNLHQKCSISGSYAGAFGLPQFLPSSAIKYGIDGNGDKKVNLFNVDDAIMSVANFLKQNGWTKNPIKTLTIYYGSGSNYPTIILMYAAALKH
jgi:membrane-bound lytic murein transglycosylase B